MEFAKKIMTEKAEKLNGKAAMLGMLALVGAYYFTGQILPIAKKVEYFLDFKRIIMRKLILGIADGRVVCDNKTVFEASDIRVGLFQD